ncbi:hypothetical protein M91_05661 [Bos mutus]|uniref:Uncharacterized protein n=1 Tax=Bos mutus TaxID=72004 RepID=L8HZU4_9CETA|nr:hypothetical protein M91_05661 [Bos mutus]
MVYVARRCNSLLFSVTVSPPVRCVPSCHTTDCGFSAHHPVLRAWRSFRHGFSFPPHFGLALLQSLRQKGPTVVAAVTGGGPEEAHLVMLLTDGVQSVTWTVPSHTSASSALGRWCVFGPHITGVKYPNLHAPERNRQIMVCVGNGESLASGLVVELMCVRLLQTGYVTDRGCPEAPCGLETMYKRNGLMASVLVTSATPQGSSSSDSLEGQSCDYASKSYDAVVFDVLKVTPEEFAPESPDEDVEGDMTPTQSPNSSATWYSPVVPAEIS